MLNQDTSSSVKFFVQSKNDDNAEFINRQKSVFEKLDAVVKDKEESIEKQNQSSNKRSLAIINKASCKKQRNDMRQFRGQESIFKRPEAPPPARFLKNIPDFKRNPQKWTKYTLSDVSSEDMSDRSNTAAAMAFLQELKKKRDSQSMDTNLEPKQITFKRPSNIRDREISLTSDDSGSSSFSSSKVVMPEYVVGERKAIKKDKPKQRRTEKSKEIKLDHLEEDDEEF